MRHIIAPAGIAAPPAHYAHAVLVEAPGRWLHTAGVVPIRPDGTVPVGVAAQAEVIWANIAALLTDAGMGPEHVVNVVAYVAGSFVGSTRQEVSAARDRFLGHRRVASTLVAVAALADPAWLLEIAVVAAD